MVVAVLSTYIWTALTIVFGSFDSFTTRNPLASAYPIAFPFKRLLNWANQLGIYWMTGKLVHWTATPPFWRKMMHLTNANDTYFFNAKTTSLLCRTGCMELHRAWKLISFQLNPVHLSSTCFSSDMRLELCFFFVKCRQSISKSKSEDWNIATSSSTSTFPSLQRRTVNIPAQWYAKSEETEVQVSPSQN